MLGSTLGPRDLLQLPCERGRELCFGECSDAFFGYRSECMCGGWPPLNRSHSSCVRAMAKSPDMKLGSAVIAFSIPWNPNKRRHAKTACGVALSRGWIMAHGVHTQKAPRTHEPEIVARSDQEALATVLHSGSSFNIPGSRVCHLLRNSFLFLL